MDSSRDRREVSDKQKAKIQLVRLTPGRQNYRTLNQSDSLRLMLSGLNLVSDEHGTEADW